MADNGNGGEDIGTYTPEEIAQAEEAVRQMTGEEYIALTKYIEGLESQYEKGFPEARSIIFTQMYSPRTGAVYHITARGTSGVQAFRDLAETIKFGQSAYKLKPVDEIGATAETFQPADQTHVHNVGNGTGVVHSGGVPLPTQPTAPPIGVPAPQVPQQQPQSPPQEGVIGQGTSRLTKIKVSEGRVEFYADGFKWPFQDSRGAETVASLFDAGLGFTAAHFAQDFTYNPEQWASLGILYIDWTKTQKIRDGETKTYYDVIRVHR